MPYALSHLLSVQFVPIVLLEDVPSLRIVPQPFTQSYAWRKIAHPLIELKYCFAAFVSPETIATGKDTTESRVRCSSTKTPARTVSLPSKGTPYSDAFALSTKRTPLAAKFG